MARGRSSLLLAAALLAGLAVLAGQARAAAPRVVVSIKPLHSLVAGVMAGIGEPALIVGGAASPHTYTLRPSEAKALERAQLVFWVGPILESFLVKPLGALAAKAAVVELDKAKGVTVLPARAGGVWEPDADEPHGGATGALEYDGHLWLDPANAKAIVRIAVERLSALDPADAERYAANGAALARRLDALDADLRTETAPLRGRPFVVFHDAYQYLERRYRLEAVGSITVNPENRPGARRVEAIRRKIAKLGVACVFTEPEFEPTLVRTITEGTKAHTGVLDPLGASVPDGPDLYFTVMRGLAKSLGICLAPRA